MPENKVNLYALYGIAHDYEDDPFDESVLPVEIIPTVTIENVSSMFKDDAFHIFEAGLNPRELKALKAVKYAFVHRFAVNGYRDKETQELEGGQLVVNIAACLRLIRPMRQFAIHHATFLLLHEQKYHEQISWPYRRVIRIIPQEESLFSISRRSKEPNDTFGQTKGRAPTCNRSGSKSRRTVTSWKTLRAALKLRHISGSTI